jgi:hypothetical protein
MAASTATYAIRITDNGGRIDTTVGDVLTYTDTCFFVAKHQNDDEASKMRVEGMIDVGGSGGELSEDPGALLTSRPAAGGETFEILESLK